MHDERLDTLLHLLKQAEVHPPLVSDSWIRSMLTPSRILLLTLPILCSVIAVTGIGYYMSRQGSSVNDDRAPRSQGLLSSDPAAASSAIMSDSVKHGQDQGIMTSSQEETSLDPRSILTLSLTDDELRRFGIRRGDDTVYVSIQSLVVDDTTRARTLGLTPEQLRDTTLLFHREFKAHTLGVTRPTAVSSSGQLLDARSPIFVQPSYDNSNGQMLVIVPSAPALLNATLLDTVTQATQTMRPSFTGRAVPGGSFAASLPDEREVGRLAASRKPILLQVWDRKNSNRVLVALMPTKAVLDSLPRRFHAALRTCYATFVPDQPRSLKSQRTPVLPQPKTKLQKLDGLSGQPFIELNGDALRRFGIVTDDVSICENGWTVATIDSSTTTFIRPVARRTDNQYLTTFSYGSEGAMRLVDGAESAVGALRRLKPDAGSSLEVHVSGRTDTVIRSYSTFTLSQRKIDSIPPADWLDRYPLARRFASGVAWDIVSAGIPTDSLCYYWVSHGSQMIPVLKLLFGLRVATPWVTRPDWQEDQRRLVRIAWYLPSQPVMNALPDHIRQFIQPEYEALYASIERSQSFSEACTLLNHPSALGFCSIGDPTLRIDGVGPIPARDVFTLYVSSDRDASASLQLVDGNGTIVQEQSAVSIRSGTNQIPVPISASLAPGAYMVILTTPNAIQRSRVLVGR